MSEFRRELRYAVFKLKHLSQEQLEYLDKMPGREDLPPLQCVVVESDWPMYEDVWRQIEAETVRRKWKGEE